VTRRAIPVAALAAAVGGELLGEGAVHVSGIEYDSRLIGPGDLFACLRGGYADGHAFAGEAVRRGAAALLVEEPQPVAVPQVRVANSRAALAGVSAAFFDHPSTELTAIGITGTDGKTTTSYIVEHLLRSAGRRTGMIGTVSVRIGEEVVDHEARQTTPESLEIQRHLRRMVDAGVTHAVLEATSHGLDLHRLDHVAFDIGAVTNITQEHLEHHGTVEAYRAAKAILFRRVAARGGVAVVNLDDEGARAMIPASEGAGLLTYSASGDADLAARDVRMQAGVTHFGLLMGGEEAPVTLPLIGAFNVSNALCAAAIASACGLAVEEIASGLGSVPQVPGRMQSVAAGQPFSVVVDYAHTPESIGKMLELLRSLAPEGRLIVVFGSAGERDVPKRALQGAVAARLADFAVFTTEDPRFEDENRILAQIAEGAIAQGWREGERFWRIPDRREAIRHALRLARSGDVVLLAGKGHERSIIVRDEKQPWDEAAVAREELTRLIGGNE
jgi:UDP-N-acetylmuramoyl-L-alanyl-D-glutamate--2,6-diaminopimelate ligase